MADLTDGGDGAAAPPDLAVQVTEDGGRVDVALAGELDIVASSGGVDGTGTGKAVTAGAR